MAEEIVGFFDARERHRQKKPGKQVTGFVFAFGQTA
jgi:hypothetical protein